MRLERLMIYFYMVEVSSPTIRGLRCFWVLVILTLVACGAGPSQESRGRASCQTQRVVDGDSVLAICGGKTVELRLACIDAPELKQAPYGWVSKRALGIEIGALFEAELNGADSYSRTLATLWQEEREINLEMVRQGNALVYRQYCEQTRYFLAEDVAIRAKRGVWDQRHLFIKPWRWRHEKNRQE